MSASASETARAITSSELKYRLKQAARPTELRSRSGMQIRQRELGKPPPAFLLGGSDLLERYFIFALASSPQTQTRSDRVVYQHATAADSARHGSPPASEESSSQEDAGDASHLEQLAGSKGNSKAAASGAKSGNLQATRPRPRLRLMCSPSCVYRKPCPS